MSFRTWAVLLTIISVWVTAFAAARPTVESRVLPPAGYVRVAVLPATFAASLRGLELVADTTLLSGDGKTQLCAENMVAATRIGAYQNESDVGVDGIVRLWGEHLWRVKPGSVSFPLDNGQTATWKDWRDGLRPKKRGGRFVFTQVTTPDGSLSNYQGYLSFVAEEMGAIALRRESTPLVDDSLSVGDLLVSVDTEGTSKVGMIVDMCKKPGGERLYLIGSSGTPSATFHILRPYSPVQGVNEWFTLEGAKWAIGQGAKTDLRRVTLK